MGSQAYTNCDIEIHMGVFTEAMPTDGIDVEATNARVQERIEQALRDAYPQYSLALYMQSGMGGPYGPRVVSLPDALDDEAVLAVIEDAIRLDDENLYVELADETEGKGTHDNR